MLTFKYFTWIFFLMFCSPPHFCGGNTNIDNQFIVKYFTNKKSPSVIGITCNEEESDFNLVRMFSELRIKSTFWKINSKVKLSSMTKTLYWNMGIFFDLRCQIYEDAIALFAEATNYRMFDETFNWLIIGSTLNESIAVINDDAFGLSTDLVLAILNEDKYILYDIYNPFKNRGGTLNITLLGTWNNKYGFRFIFDHKKIDRWNLKGMILELSGLVCIFKIVFKVVTFHREAYTEKTVWKSGERNGPMFDALIKGESDASGSPATITRERITLAKPAYLGLPFRSCFFFRSVSASQLNLNLIFEPLAPKVWFLILFFNVITINAIVLLSIFTQTHLGDLYINSILLNIGSFCQQATDFSTTRISGRIAIFHIFVFNLLINNYYMASIVSTRLNNPFKKMNDSLNELRKSDFLIASEKSLYFEFYVKRNDWETRMFYTKRWVQIPENKRFIPSEQAMPLVLNGGFAYHTLPEVAYPFIDRYFNNRKICELTEVHLVRPYNLCFYVTMNSSFTEMIKTGFNKISETGIRNRLIKRWQARKPRCRINELTIDKVTLYEVAPALLFLTLSFFISGVVLVVELLISFKSKGMTVRIEESRILRTYLKYIRKQKERCSLYLKREKCC